MASVDGTHRRGLELILRSCQELAGIMVGGDRSAVAWQMHRIAAAIPADLPMPERVMTQQIVVQTVCRVVTSVGIDKVGTSRAFALWIASCSDEDAWSTKLRR